MFFSNFNESPPHSALMLARIQQLIVFFIVGIVVAGTAAAFALSRPAWALAAPLVIAAGYVAALGIEFL